MSDDLRLARVENIQPAPWLAAVEGGEMKTTINKLARYNHFMTCAVTARVTTFLQHIIGVQKYKLAL